VRFPLCEVPAASPNLRPLRLSRLSSSNTTQVFSPGPQTLRTKRPPSISQEGAPSFQHARRPSIATRSGKLAPITNHLSLPIWKSHRLCARHPAVRNDRTGDRLGFGIAQASCPRNPLPTALLPTRRARAATEQTDGRTDREGHQNKEQTLPGARAIASCPALYFVRVAPCSAAAPPRPARRGGAALDAATMVCRASCRLLSV
jgi:hypothetical protein